MADSTEWPDPTRCSSAGVSTQAWTVVWPVLVKVMVNDCMAQPPGDRAHPAPIAALPSATPFHRPDRIWRRARGLHGPPARAWRWVAWGPSIWLLWLGLGKPAKGEATP